MVKPSNFILIILIISLVSCNASTIKIADLEGRWGQFNEPFHYFLEFEVKGSTIELIGADNFKETGVVKLSKDILHIHFNRDDSSVEYKIENLDNDTLVLSDKAGYSNRYIKNYRPWPELEFIEEYELIGINTSKKRSDDNRPLASIHFYKSNENIIRIRCSDRFVEFEEVPEFLSNGHNLFKPLVYVGKGITLKDLKMLYYQIQYVGQDRVVLGTKRIGIDDTNIFDDKIEIWGDDLERHLKSSNRLFPPVSVPPTHRSKFEYLGGKGKEIRISTLEDLSKFEGLSRGMRYVVSINIDLYVEDYIELKGRLREFEKRGIRVKSEIR